ncbi:tyrosine-type recombinase/integrase [Hwanghaeella sp.]|uniref:tyrosine-type recombinase/integrase n=1 Tax=Hwanghaeella sp. TaxID=2605943 RepID=UPI003CCBA497
MARAINKLSARFVATAATPGRYADGGGLYLQIAQGGSKSWLYRFMMSGRSRQMGLGPVQTISLAEARTKAEVCRKQVLEGIDPIDARAADRARRITENATIRTFKWCAERYIKAHAPAWQNVKHSKQWTSTLATYAYPTLAELPVGSVETSHVIEILEPIWSEKPETASRVRGRVESILDWATAHQLRQGPNPALWRGHLDKLLPKRSKVQKVKHHAALPYVECADFMVELRAREAIAARGLEFLILTAARTGEVIGSTWPEINFDDKLWVVPGDRMKVGVEHRVPLSAPAIELLEAMKALRRSDFIFPGHRDKAPLSNMAFLQLLKRMEYDGVTAHGFRSSFKDWAAEKTRYPNEVSEQALAHTISTKVEAAYRRGDLFEKRKALMDDWAAYLAQTTDAKVVRLL